MMTMGDYLDVAVMMDMQGLEGRMEIEREGKRLCLN
jgi:hypothetical protein